MPDLRIGQLASDSERFCPLAAVNKWPYRHLHGDASQKVSDAFFAAGAFRIRGWTVYVSTTSAHIDLTASLLVQQFTSSLKLSTSFLPHHCREMIVFLRLIYAASYGRHHASLIVLVSL